MYGSAGKPTAYSERWHELAENKSAIAKRDTAAAGKDEKKGASRFKVAVKLKPKAGMVRCAPGRWLSLCCCVSA